MFFKRVERRRLRVLGYVWLPVAPAAYGNKKIPRTEKACVGELIELIFYFFWFIIIVCDAVIIVGVSVLSLAQRVQNCGVGFLTYNGIDNKIPPFPQKRRICTMSATSEQSLSIRQEWNEYFYQSL